MRIALATCEDLPDHEVDDEPLHQALVDRGVDLLRPAWSDRDFAWHRLDACLIRTTWDYMERRRDYLDWADRINRKTRLFNSAEVVHWNTHKGYLRDLEARGVPTLPTCWLERGEPIDLARLLRATGWQRAFLKPAIGATARETLRFDDEPAAVRRAQAHLDRLLQREDMLLQPYQESVEQQGELSLFVIDGAVTHAVRKVPTPGDYRVQDDFGAHDEPITPKPAEIALALQAVEAVRLPDLLYARTDFLRNDDGELRLIELELVEPSLFFRHAPHAAERLADALLQRIDGRRLDDTVPLPNPSDGPSGTSDPTPETP